MSETVLKFEQMLSTSEMIQVREMNTPHRIQKFLDSIEYPAGEENRSPIEVLRERQAHCLDGGLFGAALLRRIGYPALIVDMQPEPGTDDDHVLALYEEFNCWGAVAKSNFSGLRLREPIYPTVRELVLSYFNDFFNMEGHKTLRAYTPPIDMEEFDDQNWMTDPSGVDAVEVYLKTTELIPLITPEQAEYLSLVDERSFRAGTLGLNPDGVYKPD